MSELRAVDHTDPITGITRQVLAVDPDADPRVIRAAVESAAPQRAAQQKLERTLEAHPGMLESGESYGPPSVGRLVRALSSEGVTGVRLPRCACCDRSGIPLTRLLDDGRHMCNTCSARDIRRGKANEACANCSKVRRVRWRDEDGAPYCDKCEPYAGVDFPDAVAEEVVLAVSGREDFTSYRGQIAAIVRSTAPSRHAQRLLWYSLRSDKSLLTGEAYRGSKGVANLVEALVAAEIPGIVRPACPRCDRRVPLLFAADGERCCKACSEDARWRECARCGELRNVADRTSDGRPLCRTCRAHLPANLAACVLCGKTRVVARRAVEGAYCRTCYRGRVAKCSTCGQVRPCHFADSAAPRCENCSKQRNTSVCVRCERNRPVWARDARGDALCRNCSRPTVECGTCHRLKRVGARVDGKPLCQRCAAHEPALRRPCTSCGTVDHLYSFRLCAACAAPGVLGASLSGQDGVVRAELEPLRDVLLRSSPSSLLRWLRSPGVREGLRLTVQSPGRISHDLLDSASSREGLEQLRSAMVLAGLLPARDERLHTLERWATQRIDTIADAASRKAVTQYFYWHLLRRMRGRESTQERVTHVRAQLREALKLMAWLADSGVALGLCDQTVVDRWFSLHAPRQPGYGFLKWAADHGLTSHLQLPPSFIRAKYHLDTSADDRVHLVSFLVAEPGISDHDRFAALLVVVYGVMLTRLVRLRTEDVTIEGARAWVKLGSRELELDPEVAAVAARLQPQREQSRVPYTGPSPWVFPGRRDGTHLHARRLMYRLTALDIRARSARNRAMYELGASGLPAAVMSDLLGASPGTAARWETISGGAASQYASHVARSQSS